MIKIGNPNNVKQNYKFSHDLNFICSSCNNQYTKYYKDDSQNICYLCYILRNIAFFENEIIVGKSTNNINQIDIINLTRNYIKDHDICPPLSYLSAKPVNLTILEYCRLYQMDINILNKLSLKLFFSSELDINKLGLTISLFNDDPIKIKDNYYVFTKEEELILRKHL